jgi:hypothetical protein
MRDRRRLLSPGTTMREAHVPIWATDSWRAWEANRSGEGERHLIVNFFTFRAPNSAIGRASAPRAPPLWGLYITIHHDHNLKWFVQALVDFRPASCTLSTRAFAPVRTTVRHVAQVVKQIRNEFETEGGVLMPPCQKKQGNNANLPVCMPPAGGEIRFAVGHREKLASGLDCGILLWH